MSNLSNEEALLDAVAGCPGASAGEIAHHLGIDRSNTRRDLKKLCRDGKVIGRDDGGTLRFSLVGTATPNQENALDHCRSWPGHDGSGVARSAGNSPPIIDADYTDITDSRLAPPPPSYGDVVVHQPAGMSAAARGRALVPSYGGASVPNMAGVLAKMFDFDPDGSLLEAAQNRQANALVLDENERLRTALEYEKRKAAAAQAEAKKKAGADELQASIRSVSHWLSHRTKDEEEDEELSLA